MNVGGPAVQVATLAQGLDAERFDSRLLVGSVGAGEADFLELKGKEHLAQRVPGLGPAPSLRDDLRAQVAVARVIREFRPHIVHTHTAKAGVLGRVAARGLRVPAIVHTFHGHLLYGYFSRRTLAAVLWTERVLAAASTKLLSEGARVRDELLAARVGKPGQYMVVPPGVRLPPVPAGDDARRTLALPPDALVVAFVARLTQVKRPDRFAAVALELARAYSDLVLVVAGDGELLAETQRALAPLGDRVRFTGWRPDPETVYSAADVVLLTSDNEGMPYSLIEAAWSGTPVVSTDVGSVREVVVHGTTGLVTGTGTDELVAATRRLLDDADLRRDFGNAAEVRAGGYFGVERLVEDITSLYEELARAKGFGGYRAPTGRQ